MNRQRRIEISIETSQILVLRRRPMWCRQCAARIEMLTAQEAALVAGVTLSTILCEIEDGRLHGSKAANRPLQICLNSLLNLNRQGETL